MKTGCDIQIFGVVQPQKPVPHGEVEHHEVDVELEVRGLPDALEYFRRWHQLEIDNLSIAIFGREIRWCLQVVHEQYIVSDTQPRLHTVGDGADRDRLQD